MVEAPIPGHVFTKRRDGRREILLHRSVAVVGERKVEIKAARSAVFLPLGLLLLCAGLLAWVATTSSAPLWALITILLFSLMAVPVSVMGLVGGIVGADVVVDAEKGSATWQQGYLGMGIGTKELVPFGKIDYLQVSVEGEEADRWRDNRDDVRQFTLSLVKVSGKRLTLAQIPVPAHAQEDGMDRALAVGHAVAALTGAEVRIPDGWELMEVDSETLEPVAAPPRPKADRATPRPRRRK
ncbi:MAG: hypothetical protein R3B97_04060 [Dehalococcoidia bacterium]|nr:hypothetical protein [Dehalococcoidia bacterium]MCB9485511.1 hypothetical protein [Thermoflexaceae bacterium]